MMHFTTINNILGFKKLHARKITKKQQLKEMVVGNFLNLFAVSATFLFITILTIGISTHLG